MFPFKAALNASTLFSFHLGVKEQVKIAAEAGYEGVELWVQDINAYLTGGGTVKELRRYVADTGIALVNAIAFFKWSDEDEVIRSHAFVQAEKEMELLSELGCAAIAAPPFGHVEHVSLEAMAINFARLADLASRIGIKPYLEFWGRAKRLSRLSEAMYVAMESGVPDAQILLDPFHMYTGGSCIHSLAYIKGERIGIVHANDYPAVPVRETIADRDRVFPGEGIAPSAKLAQLLYESGYRGYLSLELFLELSGSMSALDVAKTGLASLTGTYCISG